MSDRLQQIWRAEAAPDGFAERVVSEWASSRARPPSRRVAFAVVGLIAAAGLLLFLSNYRQSPRTSTEVVQRQGTVSYRVASDEHIVVRTPAGQVAASGAHFSVEVMGMKSQILSAVGGAAAVAVVVVVYQGAVKANTGGETTTLSEGETVRLPGAPSSVGAQGDSVSVSPASASREQLVARERVLVKRIIDLQSKVGRLEAKSKETSTEPSKGDPEGPPKEKFHDLSPAELEVLAERCEVRYDIPAYAMANDVASIFDRIFASTDVGETEREILEGLLRSGDPQLLKQLRLIYIEVTGDEPGAESLSPRNMQHEIFEKSAPGDLHEALRLISAERAGRQKPPSDVSERPPIERLLRALAASGAKLEKAIADQLGAERAKELRVAGVVWARRSQAGCPSQ